mmetsp:Transcript_6609/g.14430  ORF Transcript_6609/g.14430 Transcript_6609/m.14430 type:complete len:357 (-) Transcript_6609:237-1307(-)
MYSCVSLPRPAPDHVERCASCGTAAGAETLITFDSLYTFEPARILGRLYRLSSEGHGLCSCTRWPKPLRCLSLARCLPTAPLSPSNLPHPSPFAGPSSPPRLFPAISLSTQLASSQAPPLPLSHSRFGLALGFRRLCRRALRLRLELARLLALGRRLHLHHHLTNLGQFLNGVLKEAPVLDQTLRPQPDRRSPARDTLLARLDVDERHQAQHAGAEGVRVLEETLLGDALEFVRSEQILLRPGGSLLLESLRIRVNLLHVEANGFTERFLEVGLLIFADAVEKVVAERLEAKGEDARVLEVWRGHGERDGREHLADEALAHRSDRPAVRLLERVLGLADRRWPVELANGETHRCAS